MCRWPLYPTRLPPLYGDTLRIQMASKGYRRSHRWKATLVVDLSPSTCSSRPVGTHTGVTWLRFSKNCPETACVNAGFLPLLLEFHGCDISFPEEIDIRIGKQTQMLQSFSEMLHQHNRLAVARAVEEGMFEHVLLK